MKDLDELFSELPVNIQTYFAREGFSPSHVDLWGFRQHLFGGSSRDEMVGEQMEEYKKKILELSKGDNDLYNKSVDYLNSVLK